MITRLNCDVNHSLRYHGCITREEACNILGTHDGNYLVRAGLKTPGTYSLSFVYVTVTHCDNAI